VNFYNRFTQAARTFQDGLPWLAPPLSAKAKTVRRAMRVGPRPLINPAAQMIVLFSPKSACTNVAVWFFHHLGKAAEAREFSRWPHHYRLQVYYDSQLYKDACKQDLTNFKVVRVVRDPYDRVASGFRHAMTTRRARPVIAAQLNDPDIETKGMSFEQFLTFLEAVDLTACDPHFALQRHPLEDVLPVDHFINISTEDLMARLSEIERDFGLAPPGPEMAKWLAELKGHKRPKQGFAVAPDLHTRRFTEREATYGPWPDHEALLTPAVRERLRKLYAADIAAYLKSPASSN
jgi:hypothetical protein